MAQYAYVRTASATCKQGGIISVTEAYSDGDSLEEKINSAYMAAEITEGQVRGHAEYLKERDYIQIGSATHEERRRIAYEAVKRLER
ncbi:hypothetical protein HYT51_00630 [Candidatus Woesearchaeota archaeon]|nr:hypothetical protein [Candidatus Woesearchaeota archaeon]